MAPPAGISTESRQDAWSGTLEGPDTGFKWKVQLYGFNLEESDRFFLWLKRGGPENQDNMNAQRMSSPYFKITKKAVPSTTSKPSTTTDPSPSTSGSTESPSAIPTAASSTSTSANPSSTAPSPANDPETSTQGTSGLPVGAQAGIGVGVSVIGLTCIVCALLWYRHLKKKRQILADSQQNGMTNYSPGMSDAWKVPGYSQGHSLYPPAELRPGPSPVEIGTGGDIAEMPTPRDYRRAELGNR
ncbi:uncharacterized protein B0H64DRAFT_417105 [Chaetomium fimeti]|uniref:Mid2 domain-containing protein n=1 Tax=Chaetomium fimeti TaxID=1854472 RepID=A0AAE0LSM9_9PEZI|nr:hypothetical protein B0H64DRAFT_417105 [Chaetomium fimeti]